ncbi:hypothetical protein JCM8202v2_004063 [Rhodotorula sphaerocarpa]
MAAAGKKRAASPHTSDPQGQRARVESPAADVETLAGDARTAFATTTTQAAPLALLSHADSTDVALQRLSDRIKVAERENDSVRLTVAEAKQVRQSLSSSVAHFYDKPATKQDILSLLRAIERIRGTGTDPYHSSYGDSHLYDYYYDDEEPVRPSPFQQLPFDILRLVFLHLRDLCLDEIPTDSYSRSAGIGGWYRHIDEVARLSSGLRDVCKSFLRSELVTLDLRSLKGLARQLSSTPERARDVSRWTLKPMSWSLTDSDRDLGFVIPDLVQSMSNLTYLNINAHRHVSFAESVLRGRSFDFEALTGGVDMPDLIISSLPNLRELVYGTPTPVDAVVKFATTIPTLRALSVLGEVERFEDEPVTFSLCSPHLTRLWLPTTILSPVDLGKLVGVDATRSEHAQPSDASPSGEANAEQRRRLSALAFCFDADALLAADPPPADLVIAQEYTRLEYLFTQIGRDLIELHVSTPGADHPEAIRMSLVHAAALGRAPGVRNRGVNRGPPGQMGAGGGGGPPGGPGGAGPLTLTFVAGPMPGHGPGPGGPPPPPAAAAGAGPGNNAPQPPPAAAAAPPPQPAAQAGPPPPGGGQQGQPAPPGPAPPPAAGAAVPGLARGLRNLFGLGGAGGGAGGGNIAAGGNGNAANAPPNIFGGGINILFGAQTMPPAVPFFSEIVAQCPQLERVELYGRRFDSSLVNMLPPETLRRLSLSIPNEDVRGQFVDELIAQIEAGKWPHLQRLELSACGGEWPPAERRRVMKAASTRNGLVYRSTDL